MNTLEIITLVLICVGAAVAVGFLVSGIVVMFTEKRIKLPKAKKEKIVEEEKTVEPEIEEISEIDIDQMLARLEARKEEAQNAENDDTIENMEVPTIEVVEEIAAEEVEEPVEEEIVEEVEEVPAEEVEETVEEEQEEIEEVVEDVPEKEEPVIIIKEIPAETVDKFDYKTRLEKIKESKEKIERDLEKTKKAINKYERTERRRARNQKLLDKKATELTNINLVMYSVTDIKNVDQEKKAKQEELTAHISELKASIQDAEEDLAKNENKYQNNVKLLEYLKNEKHRYEEEVKELEKMLKKAGK